MDATANTNNICSLQRGASVHIINLQARKDFNGRIGVIEDILDNGRVLVSLKDPVSNNNLTISIKPENMRVLDKMEGLSSAITEFVLTTLKGIESAMYKQIPDKAMLIRAHRQMAPQLLVEYMNSTYRYLILKSSDYTTNCFASMKSFHDHSEICLLHIIMDMSMRLLQLCDMQTLHSSYKIQYPKEDFTSNYDTFMMVRSAEYERQGAFLKEGLKYSMNHECHGRSIDTCDPNLPLFSTSAEGEPKPEGMTTTRSYHFGEK